MHHQRMAIKHMKVKDVVTVLESSQKVSYCSTSMTQGLFSIFEYLLVYLLYLAYCSLCTNIKAILVMINS